MDYRVNSDGSVTIGIVPSPDFPSPSSAAGRETLITEADKTNAVDVETVPITEETEHKKTPGRKKKQ